MTKRPSQSISSEVPNKRLRSGKLAGDSSTTSTRTAAQVSWSRDPRFYFEDGSVVLLVENVLFKIQASLLKTHSEVFRDMFAMPPGKNNVQTEGTCDHRPITIPGIKASEFRNLLKMFYCPPSDRFFVGLHSGRQSDSKTWREFIFYSDVTRLSHRFGMPEFEKWAADKLTHLMVTSNTGLDASVTHAEDRIPSILLTTLAHAKLTSNTPLEHDIRHTIQRHSVYPATLSPPSLLKLMHMPGMREAEPALFGFWFLLVLSLGHENWQQEAFTKEDRIALFYAQTYLSPPPASLGKGVVFSLINKPKVTKNGHLQALKERACSEACIREISNLWGGLFDCDYYEEVTSTAAPIWISMLCQLPDIRTDFADSAGHLPACKCNKKVLGWLDDDIKRLFTRLAGYYQDIN